MVEISQNAMYILWAALIIIFAVFEAVTAQLVSIWFVVGALISLISAFLGANLAVQIIVFIAVSVLALVITRPLVKKYINPRKERTNADKVLGQVGIVVEDISNIQAKGQVKIDGKIWSARSLDNSVIPEGERVIIDKIEGVKLIVKSIS